MNTGYVWHELYAWHDTNQGSGGTGKAGLHVQPLSGVESPETKSRLNGIVHVSGLIDSLVKIPARYATEEDLLRVHTPEYVRSIREQSDLGGGDGGDGITPFGRGGYEIAQLAAGGTTAALEAVLTGVVRNAYALVRPPGHHATAGMGMGACIFANIAVAIRWAQQHVGLGRVAVVDWDVHHGNGTQAIFEADPTVLTISLHQEQLFPFDSGHLHETGSGPAANSILNIPLPAGTGNGGYRDAVTDVVVPALKRFRPEVIIVACGFDASAMDPLGNQVVTSSGYRDMTRALMGAAEELCDGRLVVSHEGGYSPLYVPYCGLAVLEQLSGVRTEISDHLEDLWARGPAARTTTAQRDVINQARALARSLGLPHPDDYAPTVD